MLTNSITLEACEAEWKDIKKLCSIKQLIKRDWRSDVGYGLMDIYVDAAGFEHDYCPDVNMMHGLFIGMTDAWYRSSEANFRSIPVLIVHNEPDRIHLQKVLGSAKRVIVAPHPFHYVIQSYKSEQLPEARTGSVFFFPHSLGQPVPLVPVDFILKKLRDLQKIYHPIDICLHVADVDDVLIDKIQTYGFGVVSCGHRHDARFLHRLYWLCQRRKYSINTGFGSQLILSALAGCEIVYLRDIPEVFMIPANDSWDHFVAARENYWPLLDALDKDNIDQELVRKLISENTGFNHWKSAKQLRDIFLDAHNLYCSWKTAEGRMVLSPRCWHLVELLLLKFRAYRNAISNRLSGNRGRWNIVQSNPSILLMKYKRAQSNSTG